VAVSESEVIPPDDRPRGDWTRPLEAPEEMGRSVVGAVPEFVRLMDEVVGLVQLVMSYVHSPTKGTAL
jgi:hypothetical protein